jgi:hypothetical protein
MDRESSDTAEAPHDVGAQHDVPGVGPDDEAMREKAGGGKRCSLDN